VRHRKNAFENFAARGETISSSGPKDDETKGAYPLGSGAVTWLLRVRGSSNNLLEYDLCSGWGMSFKWEPFPSR